MAAWTVAIIDSGISEAFEAEFGPDLFEFDEYSGGGSTIDIPAHSHGSRVARALELTAPGLERIDLQVTDSSGSSWSPEAETRALGRVLALDDGGWNIGAVNMSFGAGNNPPAAMETLTNALAARGIIPVAAAGNNGTAGGLESPLRPARYEHVISVGSHDGNGVPSAFSQNSPDGVHILADGEDFPRTGENGTSYATPQVSATVAEVQAVTDTLLGRPLGFDEVVDVLQQGGAAALSAPDPANASIRYPLYDHAASIDYLFEAHLSEVFSPFEYVASHTDLTATIGADATAARRHYADAGVFEERSVTGFDGLAYVASHGDLIAAIGDDADAGAGHYLASGRTEGRSISFDADAYLAANADVAAAVSGDAEEAVLHYIRFGWAEGRATDLAGQAPDGMADPGWIWA